MEKVNKDLGICLHTTTRIFPLRQELLRAMMKSSKKAASIYRGIARKGVAACTACHSPSGKGNSQAGYLKLGRSTVDYTIAQLTKYKRKVRKTDESFGGMMRGVAETLTDSEIAILADYIRGLH